MSDVAGERTGAAIARHRGNGSQKGLFFDVVLHPHRSLSRTGFGVLMIVVALVSVVESAPFLAVGAWPVLVFVFLNMALVYTAFHFSYRSARAFETLQLGSKHLVVRKVEADGSSKCWRLEPYWLQIDMDDPASHDSQLVLTCKGKRLIVGAFLTPEERLEVAEALGAAMARRQLVLSTT